MTTASRWIASALALSVLVNVFAVGHLAGRGLGGPEVRDRQPRDPVQEMRIFRDLPAQTRADIRTMFRDQIRINRPDRRALRDAKRQVRNLLDAPGPLDEAALATNFAEIRTLRSNMQARFEKAFLELLVNMDEDERAAVAPAIYARAMRANDTNRMPRRPGLRNPNRPPPE